MQAAKTARPGAVPSGPAKVRPGRVASTKLATSDPAAGDPAPRAPAPRDPAASDLAAGDLAATGNVAQGSKARPRVNDTEKLTINLGSVDLGSIDLLVAEGFFSNRSDLIRTAVRNLLASHRDVVNNALARQERSLGLRRISRAELEALRAAGQLIRISVVGLVVIDDDVTPELAQATIASLSVLGSLQVSPAVRRALAGRLV